MSRADQRGPLVRMFDGAEYVGRTFMIVVVGLLRGLVPPRPLRALGRVAEQLHVQLVKSLVVVAVVGTFMGMILVLQTGEELKTFGAQDRLPYIVAGAMAREMGPFITAIILAATVGAAIAAELGTMRVSEEIDALELMNIDPVPFLVSPRIIALAISSVLLTVLVNIIGVGGGALVASAQYGIEFASFFEGAAEALAGPWLLGFLSKHLYAGLIKSLVLGLIIGGLSCASGLAAEGGALGVGRAVRTAVVASVIASLIVGYILTWVFWVVIQ